MLEQCIVWEEIPKILLPSPFPSGCYCSCCIYLQDCILLADIVYCKAVELLNRAVTSFIVKNNRPLSLYSNLQKITVQLKSQDIVILVAFLLSEEVQTASLKPFIHICRAAESMFLLARKTWSSFLQSQGSLAVSGTSCQFLLKQGFTSKSQPQTNA